MDFGLAFMTPGSQTVNVHVAYKYTRAGEIYGFWLRYFVYFFEFLRKVFELADKAQFEVHL